MEPKSANYEPTFLCQCLMMETNLYLGTPLGAGHLPVFATFNFIPTDNSITLHLTALIEGFYNGVYMIPDTVKVFLRQAVTPYGKVDSVKIRLDSTGFGIGKFNNAPSGTYYLAITHRNSIETWSREGGEPFVRGEAMIYDFTTAQNKAYGGNMKPK